MRLPLVIPFFAHSIGQLKRLREHSETAKTALGVIFSSGFNINGVYDIGDLMVSYFERS